MVTDIYGQSGSGKSQLCFTITSNYSMNGGRALFIDTSGTFRPERIIDISHSQRTLEHITVLRALTTSDQTNAIQRIREIDPGLVVVDTLTGLFSAELGGPSRHLAVMKHLHALALCAIETGCAIVFTNMVRSVPPTLADQTGYDAARPFIPAQQREYLGSSVSIYSHARLRLEIVNQQRSISRATLVHPPTNRYADFIVSQNGVSDFRPQSEP